MTTDHEAARRSWRLSPNSRFITWCFVVMLLPLVAFAVASGVTVLIALARTMAHPEMATVRGLFTLLLVLPVTLLMLRSMLRELAPHWVSVGPDGVAVRQRFARPRFIGIGAIDRVQVSPREGCLRLREAGGAVTVITGREIDELQAIADAIEANQRAALEGEGPPVVAPLARGDQTRDEWRRRAEALLRRPDRYRSQVMEPDELWRVVEHPTAPLDQRIGAVLALRARVDEPDGAQEIRRRVRVAAEACVLPKLRVALYRAAEGEVDDRLLAEAEAEQAPTRVLTMSHESA